MPTGTMPTRPVPNARTRPNSAAEVASLLRREIVSGRLQHRDRLPPGRVLAEKYDVARGTIRQALLRLAADSLVETRPGSGTYVTHKAPTSGSDAIGNAGPLELIDARFALEPHICRLAVLHARRTDLEQADALLSRMEASTEAPNDFSDADARFHTLLAETTGNGLLIWMVEEVSAVRNHEQWSRMLTLTLTPAMIARYNAQHRDVLEAIRAREPERAAQLMKAHLETARLSLTRAAAT